eukprot:g7831.t1
MSFGSGFGFSSSPGAWGASSTYGIQPTSGSNTFNTGSSSTGFFGFQSSTPLFIGQPSSGNWFNTGAQSSSGFLGTSSSTGVSSFWPNPSIGQQTSPFGSTTGTQWFPQQVSAQSQNPFRDQFRAALVRKDKLPLSHVTRLEELEENGQSALKMILDEVEVYENFKEEISKSNWFQKDTKTEDLDKDFDEKIREMEVTLGLHETLIDEVGKQVQHEESVLDEMRNAIRNAEQIQEELEALKKGMFGMNRSVSNDGVGFKSRFETPDSFILSSIQNLNKRFDALVNQIESFESALMNQDESEREWTKDDFVRLIKIISDISSKIETESQIIDEQIEYSKEMYLEELRRSGDMENPFLKAEEEEKEREKSTNMYTMVPQLLQGGGAAAGSHQAPVQPQTTSALMQPMTSVWRNTTPLIGAPPGQAFGTTRPMFGASTGSAFGASTGPVFGASTGPVFGASTGPVFGASTGGVFGASTGQRFGMAGAGGSFGNTTSSMFGGTGFGNTSPSFGTNLFGSGPSRQNPSGRGFGRSA